jgi:16S rRNA (cytosine967-C5)-methyltransferase
MNKKTGRQLAWTVLNRVATEASYVNLALSELFAESGAVEQREKAFCTELVYGTLRHLLKIDHILGRLLSRPFGSLPVAVQNLLRIGLYQLLFLREIPERAVCHSAVALIKDSQYRGLAPLINGVLRNYLRVGEQLVFPDPDNDRLNYLSIEYSHPLWLVKRWLQRFGPEKTEAILRADNERSPLTVRLNRRRGDIPTILQALEAEGIGWQPGRWLPEAVNLAALPMALEETAAFRSGTITPQDESSMLVAHVLQPLPGEFILDLCAAPGGKSTHMAELMGDRGRIVSLDDYQHKVGLITKNARRLGLQSIHPTLGDARKFSLPQGERADAVLVDAPCSGTGVLRRRIDARYRRQPEEVGQLAELQREILHNAALWVRPGGRLIYSTCTLEPEENQDQSEWFIQNHPDYELADCRNYLPEKIGVDKEEPRRKGLTILPGGAAGSDGFFICRFNRTR